MEWSLLDSRRRASARVDLINSSGSFSHKLCVRARRLRRLPSFLKKEGKKAASGLGPWQLECAKKNRRAESRRNRRAPDVSLQNNALSPGWTSTRTDAGRRKRRQMATT
jgi:hypothetical protein